MNRALILSLLFGAAIWPAVAADGVKGAYKRPTVTVPYAREKPTIDGTIDDDEWRGAESVNALQTTRHQISPRGTRFWMMWDEDHLYVAMRSPLRPGEMVVQKFRDPARDTNVVFDDSYEVWLDIGAKDAKTGLKCFVQFLCNYAGVRYDVLHLPAVGNSRLGYTSGWQPKNRITPDGKAWEWELKIPRQSIYKDTPFADGFSLTCLVARNFKRPWEQNSLSGTSSFAVGESHSMYILRKEAPAIQVLRVADYASKSLGLELAVAGQRNETIGWRFSSDGGIDVKGALEAAAGKVVRLPWRKLDQEGKGNYRITVGSADGKTTYFDWCAERKFGQKKGLDDKIEDTLDKYNLRVEFNPVHNYLRVFGDFIYYAAREDIARWEVLAADKSGVELGRKELALDKYAYVRGVLQLPDVTYGEYRARLEGFDKAGKSVLIVDSEFAKKDPGKEFDWWQTSMGNIGKVIDPWTPVQYHKGGWKRAGSFDVWGRTMTVGPAGLPQQVTTQGFDLMADDAELTAELADGAQLTAEGSKVLAATRAPHRAMVDVESRLGPIKVKSRVTVEFDGMYKVEMRLDPGRESHTLRNLKVVVPLRGEAADYIHAAGEGIRTGFYYGFLDKDKEGTVWDSRQVDSQPMRAGSFIPYLWIGSPKGGLCWFADSDEGWAPSDAKPAIELIRGRKGRIDLVLNLVSAETVIDAPRRIVFAFQASPVKKLHPEWRMDSWWCGDTFFDYASSGSTIWAAIPFPRDKKKCTKMVETRHRAKNSYIFGINKYRANAVPYFIHQTLPARLVPEVKYFGDQWRTSVSECLYYGPTLTDYIVHNLGTWARECGIDGWYIDNMRPVVCDNIDAGRGYRLPDGRIQPTYQMFSTRRYFLRMRAAFAEQGKHDKIVLHMTNNMILPWVAAAGMAYDGEHHVIYPESGHDFMDKWSLERLRVDYPGQWGVAVNFMHEYQGKWERPKLLKAMRAYTGAVILHDVLPSGNANAMNQPLWIGRDRFGIQESEVEFVPYWDKDSGISCATKDVYVAAWKRPGKVLLAVVNWGDKAAAEVRLDAKKLGLDKVDKWTVVDAEAGTKIGRKEVEWSADSHGPIERAKNVLTVPVERHDYRQIIVGPKPPDDAPEE